MPASSKISPPPPPRITKKAWLASVQWQCLSLRALLGTSLVSFGSAGLCGSALKGVACRSPMQMEGGLECSQGTG